MILDANGRPFTQSEITMARVTDVTKSFSYKLSLKDENGQKTYESADFFCAMKANVTADDDPAEVGRDLHDMCMESVQDDIRQFNERRLAKRQAARATRSTAA